MMQHAENRQLHVQYMELIEEQSNALNRLIAQELTPEVGFQVPNGGSRPRLLFREAIRRCWDKYADFNGRARRSEYWWFCLFSMLVFFVPLMPLAILYKSFDLSTAQGYEVMWVLPAILLGIALIVSVLILLCPIFAVTTRRLHDVGRSGWWIVWDVVLTVVSSIVLSVAYWSIGYASTSASTPGDLEMLKAISSSTLPLSAVVAVYTVYLAHIAVEAIIFIFTLLDSYKGKNKYGLSPKYSQSIETGEANLY